MVDWLICLHILVINYHFRAKSALRFSTNSPIPSFVIRLHGFSFWHVYFRLWMESNRIESIRKRCWFKLNSTDYLCSINKRYDEHTNGVLTYTHSVVNRAHFKQIKSVKWRRMAKCSKTWRKQMRCKCVCIVCSLEEWKPKSWARIQISNDI